jgi:hypothetical protein
VIFSDQRGDHIVLFLSVEDGAWTGVSGAFYFYLFEVEKMPGFFNGSVIFWMPQIDKQ